MTDKVYHANKYQAGAMATHYVLGYQQEVADNYELEVELFYKTYENIYTFNYNVGADIQTSTFNENGNPIFNTTNGVFNRGDGNSRGFEVLFRKDVGNVTGWIGYSFARTKYTLDGINQNRSFHPRHDRSSTLNIVCNYNFKK